MIELLNRYFGRGNKKNLDSQQEEKLPDIRVATCALFLEMANIDGEFSDEERESIISILRKDHDLPKNEAAALVEAAREELKSSIDLWQFTHVINQNYSDQEKYRIVEMLWKIIYVDGTLDKHEDYLVHKVSRLLQLSHEELIDAKLRILRGERSDT